MAIVDGQKLRLPRCVPHSGHSWFLKPPLVKSGAPQAVIFWIETLKGASMKLQLWHRGGMKFRGHQVNIVTVTFLAMAALTQHNGRNQEFVLFSFLIYQVV